MEVTLAGTRAGKSTYLYMFPHELIEWLHRPLSLGAGARRGETKTTDAQAGSSHVSRYHIEVEVGRSTESQQSTPRVRIDGKGVRAIKAYQRFSLIILNSTP